MNDGWCVDCGVEFHLDDCGGYNPPCPCGCGLCRSCCKYERQADADEDMYYEEQADRLEYGEPTL